MALETLHTEAGDSGEADDSPAIRERFATWKAPESAPLPPGYGDVQAPALSSSRDVAIVGGKVLTMAGAAVEKGTVLIRNGKIAAVGTDVEIPPGVEVIDAKGLTVTPGLINAGTTVGLSEIGAVSATRDEREIQDVNSSVKAAVAIHPHSGDDPRHARERRDDDGQRADRRMDFGPGGAHRPRGLDRARARRQEPARHLGPLESRPAPGDPYDAVFRAAALLEKAGVPFCFRTGGATNARNLPFHAGLAVAFGLSRESAWRAMTRRAAEILGVSQHYGSLEVGKVANVVVAEGDLLDVPTRVRYVFIRGQSVDLSSRHTRLYEKFRARPRPAVRGTDDRAARSPHP